LTRPLFIVWNRLKPFEQCAVCSESVFWTLNHLVTSKVYYMEKNAGMFSSRNVGNGMFSSILNFFSTEERKTWMTWGWVNYQQTFFLKS